MEIDEVKMKAILTVMGKEKVGIIAGISLKIRKQSIAYWYKFKIINK